MYLYSITSVVPPTGLTELATAQLDAVNGGQSEQELGGKILVRTVEVVLLTAAVGVLQAAVAVKNSL